MTKKKKTITEEEKEQEEEGDDEEEEGETGEAGGVGIVEEIMYTKCNAPWFNLSFF